MSIPFDQVIPLQGLYPREIAWNNRKNFMHKDSNPTT